MDKAEEIFLGLNSAKSDRANWEGTWEDALYFTCPRKRGIASRKSDGAKAPYDVYDTTAIDSSLTLAAGLSGWMTNASQRWFELAIRDKDLNDNAEVKGYLGQVQEIMYSSLAQSNFYQQAHELYLDLALGTGVFYNEDDERDDIRFFCRHIREIYAVEDEREEVRMVYRVFELTAWQAYSMFGKQCGESIRKSVEEEKKYTKRFEFVHYVGPRHIREAGKKDSMNMPYESVWLSKTDKKIVKESGYTQFPFQVVRFTKTSTEVYGYGPSINVYPEIKMLNEIWKYAIEATELQLYPPQLAEHDSLVSTLDLSAAAINYQRQPLSNGPAVQALNTGVDIKAGEWIIGKLERKIQKAYFVDLFHILQDETRRTATEIIQNAQENMRLMGPVIGRLQNELLNPVINNLYDTLIRRGKLPPLPEKLAQANYDIVYVSPLAKAQRAAQANDTVAFLQIIGQMAALVPQIMDKINADKAVDYFAKSKSVDSDLILDSEQVDKIRTARAQAQAKAEQMAAIMSMATAAKDGAGAAKGFAEAQNAGKEKQ